MLPILISPDDLRMHHITKGGTVRLGVLAGPEISDTPPGGPLGY